MQKPNPTIGMHHLALNVVNLEQCLIFYKDLLGMKIEWQPDEDNIYLTSGYDNLALHRAPKSFKPQDQKLDHLGFILKSEHDVDSWHNFLAQQGITILRAPKTHRDGCRSFYCQDPDDNVVQLIWHPTLAKNI